MRLRPLNGWRGAGFTVPQAEALSDTMHQAIAGGVATKAEPADLRTELIDLHGQLRGEITEIKSDLIWMKGVGGVIVALPAVPIVRDLLEALIQ